MVCRKKNQSTQSVLNVVICSYDFLTGGPGLISAVLRLGKR